MQAGRQDDDRLLRTVNYFDCNPIFSGQFWNLPNHKMFSVEDRTTEQASQL